MTRRAQGNQDEAQFGSGELETPPDEPGLPLEELGRAYAELLGRGHDPYEPAAATEPGAAEDAAELPDEGPPEAHGAYAISPLSILEAMLFVGHPRNEPLTSEQVASLMRGVRPGEIDQLVRELNQRYDEQRCPYTIASVGAGYRLVLREHFLPLRNKFYGRIREARLSQAAVDVLALVAYHPGIARDEVDRLRGKPSAALLAQLVRRELLRVERGEGRPRVVRYYPTDRFLAVFRLSDLDELPRSQELNRLL